MYPCTQVPKVGQKLTGVKELSQVSLDNLVLVLAFFVPPSPPPPSSSSGPSANSGPVTHTILSHMPPCLTTNMALGQTITATSISQPRQSQGLTHAFSHRTGQRYIVNHNYMPKNKTIVP